MEKCSIPTADIDQDVIWAEIEFRENITRDASRILSIRTPAAKKLNLASRGSSITIVLA